ncbi:hypothetical protein ACGYLH_01020 [Weissella confusa]|uniref:hypothetical protein n=1 Tax=Weissella confusa TaxID=1583 RepID=UPI0037464002
MKKGLLILLTVVLAILMPVSAHAMAGGHSAGGGGHATGGGGGRSTGYTSTGGSSHYYGGRMGGGVGAIVLLPMIGLVGVGVFANKKLQAYQEQRDALGRFPGKTKREKEALRLEIERRFLAIQVAWNRMDLIDSIDQYEPGLYAEHLRTLGEMTERHERNVTKNVSVDLIDQYVQTKPTEFHVRISGTVVDYVENTETGVLVSGSYSKQSFSQIWYFEWQPKTKRWVASYII